MLTRSSAVPLWTDYKDSDKCTSEYLNINSIVIMMMIMITQSIISKYSYCILLKLRSKRTVLSAYSVTNSAGIDSTSWPRKDNYRRKTRENKRDDPFKHFQSHENKHEYVCNVKVYHHAKFECHSWNIVRDITVKTTGEKKGQLWNAVVTLINGQGHQTEKILIRHFLRLSSQQIWWALFEK